MTFIIMLLILSGLALVAAGVEDKPILTYIQSWIGTNNASK